MGDHDHSHHMHHPVENLSVTTVMPPHNNHDDHSMHGAVTDGGSMVNHAMHHMMEMAVRLSSSVGLQQFHELLVFSSTAGTTKPFCLSNGRLAVVQGFFTRWWRSSSSAFSTKDSSIIARIFSGNLTIHCNTEPCQPPRRTDQLKPTTLALFSKLSIEA